MQPVHIIGGGLAGCEAAWQIARRGVPVVLHEMRPVRSTAAHKTEALAELVCSNSFRSDDRDDQRGRPAARGDAPARLADHARGRHASGAGRRRARGRPRRLFRRRDGGDRRASADRAAARGDRAAAGRTGTRSSSRPAPSPRRRSPTRSASLTGEDATRLLRRDRADRASRLDRHVGRVVPVALRQGRARRHRRRLHQLPARRASNTRRSSRRCSPATRPRSTSGRPRRPISTAACRSR